jgi:lipid-A-disaccharide synthase
VGEPVERRFLIVAGEASGDVHAARLVTALRGLGPCRVRGVTGPALEAAGAEREVAMEELAVLGFSGVIPRLPRIWRAYRRLLALYDSMKPDVCILVDSPGFNFRLGPALKRRGARIDYYIAPQVWAWHAERAGQMAAWVDRLAVVFPFEQPLFRAAGVNATFVGHPLLDELAPEVDESTFRRELDLPPGSRWVGLLPGSRRQEVRQHAERMLEAARELSNRRPDLVFVMALSPGADVEGLRDEWTAKWGAARSGALRVVVGRTRTVQAGAVACAVASGTASLETALFGTPLAIVYRVGALNYAIARRVIKLTRIGLPNIVAESEVAPELLQDEFTPSRLAATLAPWIDDPAANAAARARLAVVRERLGTAGASARAASLVMELAAS